MNFYECFDLTEKVYLIEACKNAQVILVFIALGYCITFSSSGQAAAVSSKAAFWSSEAYVFLNGKKSYVSKEKQCIGFLKNNCPNCLPIGI